MSRLKNWRWRYYSWIQPPSGSATISAAGVHVMEDIPTEVAIAQQALDPELKIALQPPGTHLGLSGLLATQMVATLKADA